MKSALSWKGLSVVSTLFSLSFACSITKNSMVTFYGYADNSPPGASTAHDCGGRNYIAGGTGSYADPLTFATAPGEFEVCEIVYLPLLKKYLRYEDDCEACIGDFKDGKHHIDIWTGSSTANGGNDQVNCEDDLTSGGMYEVVRQPGTGYEVDTGLLYQDGNCGTSHTYEHNGVDGYCNAGRIVGGGGPRLGPGPVHHPNVTHCGA